MICLFGLFVCFSETGFLSIAWLFWNSLYNQAGLELRDLLMYGMQHYVNLRDNDRHRNMLFMSIKLFIKGKRKPSKLKWGRETKQKLPLQWSDEPRLPQAWFLNTWSLVMSLFRRVTEPVQLYRRSTYWEWVGFENL